MFGGGATWSDSSTPFTPLYRVAPRVWVCGGRPGHEGDKLVVKLTDDQHPWDLLQNEARCLALVQGHPHVVRMIEYNADTDRLVLERARQSLETWVLSRSDPLPRTDAEVRRLIQQLLSALAHCHARGVVHCDVKATNLLVSYAGDLVLADFDLAVRSGTAEAVVDSCPEDHWGHVGLLPPEVLVGGESRVTPARDLWACGCLLYWLLTGHDFVSLHETDPQRAWAVVRFRLGARGWLRWRPGEEPAGSAIPELLPSERTRRGQGGPQAPEPEPEPWSAAAWSLLRALLRPRPEHRLTAVEALRHPWFSQ